jgi:hypothetical protein
MLTFRRPRRIVLSVPISRSNLHNVCQPGEDLHIKLTRWKTPYRLNSSTAEAPPSSEAQTTTNDGAGGASDISLTEGSSKKLPSSRSQMNELDMVFGKEWASRAKDIDMNLYELTKDIRKLFKRSQKFRHLLDSNDHVSPSSVVPLSHIQRGSCIDIL